MLSEQLSKRVCFHSLPFAIAGYTLVLVIQGATNLGADFESKNSTCWITGTKGSKRYTIELEMEMLFRCAICCQKIVGGSASERKKMRRRKWHSVREHTSKERREAVSPHFFIVHDCILGSCKWELFFERKTRIYD
jgi:hypothetical protein